MEQGRHGRTYVEAPLIVRSCATPCVLMSATALTRPTMLPYPTVRKVDRHTPAATIPDEHSHLAEQPLLWPELRTCGVTYGSGRRRHSTLPNRPPLRLPN